MKSSLLILFVCAAAAVAEESSAALHKLTVQSLDVAEAATDRLRLRFRLSGTAERDIHIRAITFDDASINGVPVFAAPKSGPIHIPKGTSFSAVEPVEATIYFRDVPTLEPLRRLVREEKATVRAKLRLQPEFNLVQQIALWTSSAWVSFTIDRETPLRIPGGTPGKMAAELTLAAADTVWIAGQRGVQWRRERDRFIQDVRRIYAPRVLVTQTSYQIARKDGGRSTLVRRGLAFHTGDGEIVTSAEVVQPWLFDSSVADLIASGAVRLIPETVDVRAGSGSFRGSLTVEAIGRDGSKGLSIERRRTFALRDRASLENTARLRSSEVQGSRVPEMAKATHGNALFRLRDDGSLEVLDVSVTTNSGRLSLVDPIDSRSFGSPVIRRDGVVGIVVSQTTIVPLHRFRKH